MAGYLEEYGIEDQRRGRVVKRVVGLGIAAVFLAIAGYLFFHNFSEKRTVSRFLDQVNARNYQEAYREWGCTSEHPCPNYDFHRFMEDWGPSKQSSSPWKVAAVDGCKTFVTVNVEAAGAPLQSLSVDRGDGSLGFAPSPECQEKQWRWKQFLGRIFHGGATSQ